MLRALLTVVLLVSNISVAMCANEPLTLPIPNSATEAANQVKEARQHAQRALKVGATRSELQQSADELEQLLALFDKQPYRDFQAAALALYAERLNIAIALAGAQARLGHKEQALRALESTTGVVLAPVLASAIVQDPSLSALREEPRFRQVAAKHQLGGIMSSKSFASPYATTLTREQRIAGLSLFWSEVRHNFANVDLMPQQNWDAVYLDYLGRVERADTTASYYEVLMKLAPLLHDGHTNIYPPEQLSSHFFARPPLETAFVEDAVVVTAVHDVSLAQRIRPGDRILAIDDVDVKTYAERKVKPFVSSSTDQDRKVRMYSYQLLFGDAQTPVTLTLADGKNSQYTLSLPRSGWNGGAEPRFPFRMLPGGLAYLKLDDFESDGGIKAFEAAWPAIRKAKGLILDVRTNGGGSTEFGKRILSRLSSQPIQPTLSRVRFEEQSFRAQVGASVSWQPLAVDLPTQVLPNDQIFKGPVALLIGPRTFSAAEDFTAMFAQARRGPLVGEATGGSTGQPLKLDLPGGGTARICVKRDTYADGSDFVGTGIKPTLVVKTTIAAIRNGQDPVLKSAADMLLANPSAYGAAP